MRELGLRVILVGRQLKGRIREVYNQLVNGTIHICTL